MLHQEAHDPGLAETGGLPEHPKTYRHHQADYDRSNGSGRSPRTTWEKASRVKNFRNQG